MTPKIEMPTREELLILGGLFAIMALQVGAMVFAVYRMVTDPALLPITMDIVEVVVKVVGSAQQ